MNPGDFENVMMSSRPSFTIELGLTNHLNFTIKTLKKIIDSLFTMFAASSP